MAEAIDYRLSTEQTRVLRPGAQSGFHVLDATRGIAAPLFSQLFLGLAPFRITVQWRTTVDEGAILVTDDYVHTLHLIARWIDQLGRG